MEVGMDDGGYDCSGLVIASICEALGLNASNWNRDYRHLRQIERLAKDGIVPNIGDILVFYPENETETWTHMGIMATASSTIHADGIHKQVVESPTEEISTNYKVVPLQLLIEHSS
jgi:cell wall-associated NlpC family hydrolase